ncbi:MAG: hypothetical protein KF830_18730 [Planctomycetes bacterium]|nr:hypothetical protein [Planctomycetota bacterium]
MTPGRRTALAGALALAAACSREPDRPHAAGPRQVDLATIAADALVDAVLDECHRPLRGRVDRIAATVELPDGGERRLFAHLPDRLRVVGPDGSFLLLDGAVHQLHADGAEPAAPAAARQVERLRTLLDGALLGPLHRAQGCQRTGPTTWAVRQADGTDLTLELRPGTLLPQRLGQVRFVDFLRTRTTWVVQQAELDGLGLCRLRFVFDDLAWAPDFFTLRARPAAAATVGARVRLPVAAGEARSAEPFLVDAAATRWLVVEDPGDWAERSARYAPLHDELLRQQQHVAGFPLLWQQDGRRWLAAPFRRRAEGPEFVPPAGCTLQDAAAGRWLVVYPPDGDFAARLADGERRLREALAAMALGAAGPVVAQPFVHLEEGPPSDAALATPVVRMSVPVR